MTETLTPDTLEAPESAEVDNQTQDVTESTGVDNQQVSQIPAQKKPEVEAQPYTYEELQSLNFTELDPKRLPKANADMANAYKSLQGEYTKTKERLSSIEKQVPRQEPQPRDAFEAVSQAFNKNDYTTISNIFGHLKGTIHQKKMELYQTKQKDILDPKIGALESEIYQYESLGDKLQGNISNLAQQRQVIDSLVSTTESELFKAIPDFKERAPTLMDFAVKELKLEPEIIYAITDPVAWTAVFMQGGRNQSDAFRLGKDTVVKIQDAINKLQLRISGKGLSQKVDKTPPKVEGTGSNYSETKGLKSESLFNKAQKTGLIEDWAAYQDAVKGEKSKK